MPIGPDHGARLSWATVDIVTNAELAILRVVAQHLRAGLDSPQWAQIKLAELQLLRARVLRDLQSMDASLAREVGRAMQSAYTDGQAMAVVDLEALGARAVLPPAQLAAVSTIAQDTAARVTGAAPRILRSVTDAYQQAVGDSLGGVILGAQTRRQAAQTALDRLLGQGITGFTDTAGRNWRLESYTEMAVRTGAGASTVAGHVDTLSASGQDLIQVIPGPRPCPICDAWTGKILSITGGISTAISPKGRVDVDATLDQAKADGLFHPNCRCNTGIYLPGVTETVVHRPDPRGYEAQQQQRSLERNIRAAKRKNVLSLDDARDKATMRQVREGQADLRAHLAAHPELKRQSHREQIGKAL